MNHVANGPEPDDEDTHSETLAQNLVVVTRSVGNAELIRGTAPPFSGAVLSLTWPLSRLSDALPSHSANALR